MYIIGVQVQKWVGQRGTGEPTKFEIESVFYSPKDETRRWSFSQKEVMEADESLIYEVKIEIFPTLHAIDEDARFGVQAFEIEGINSK